MDKMMFWEELIMTTTDSFHERHTLAPIYISKMLLIEWPEQQIYLVTESIISCLPQDSNIFIFYICFNVRISRTSIM